MTLKSVNDLVKQVRLDVGLGQKEARNGVMDKSSYSKFENNKKNINYSELLAILKNLQVPFRDFLDMYLEPNLERTIRKAYYTGVQKFITCGNSEEIISIYEEVERRFPELSIDELTVYFDIKANFHKKYPEAINPITPKEQKFVLDRFYSSSNDVMFEEEYRLISQIINDIDPDEIINVIDHIFPIDKAYILSEKIKQHIGNIFLNAITPLLFRKEYDKAEYILKIADEHKFIYDQSYFYLAQFTYLNNLYLYLAKNDISGIIKANEIISAIKLIGDKGSSELMEKEVKKLVEGKQNTGFTEYDILMGKN